MDGPAWISTGSACTSVGTFAQGELPVMACSAWRCRDQAKGETPWRRESNSAQTGIHTSRPAVTAGLGERERSIRHDHFISNSARCTLPSANVTVKVRRLPAHDRGVSTLRW
ncbi:hypothetical protein GCM10027161_18250 [Microbispora hainanensis]